MHSTNYQDAFIEVADDCKAQLGTEPPEKASKTVARLQYEMLRGKPYAYTSDELIFTIHADRNAISARERKKARDEFFSKGQPCLRSSPLAKTYGWGIHFDGKSRVAIYGKESAEYARLKQDKKLTHLKAMKSKR
jgi:hypothetical protein